MLLFISPTPRKYPLSNSFQYISCYSLSGSSSGFRSLFDVSIHLMLLFIIVLVCRSPYHIRFQYISCYSLSILCKLNKTNETSFNTSHVTLYPIEDKLEEIISKFQYISCYSLSGERCGYDAYLKFQYISCYSLS